MCAGWTSTGGFWAAFASAEQQGSSFTNVQEQRHIPTRFSHDIVCQIRIWAVEGLAGVLKSKLQKDSILGLRVSKQWALAELVGCTHDATGCVMPVCTNPILQCVPGTAKWTGISCRRVKQLWCVYGDFKSLFWTYLRRTDNIRDKPGGRALSVILLLGYLFLLLWFTNR